MMVIFVCLLTILQEFETLISMIGFENGSASEFGWRILKPEG
jgi:hypothetical protein